MAFFLLFFGGFATENSKELLRRIGCALTRVYNTSLASSTRNE